MALSCPVCKECLREDETLHGHLNTHPKQQVIEALIQLKVALRDANSSSSVQGSSSIPPESEKNDNTSEGDFQKIFRPSSPDSHDGNDEEEDWSSSTNAPFVVPPKSASSNHPVQISPESENIDETSEGDFQKIFRPNSPDSHDCNEDIEEEDWNSSTNAPFAVPPKSTSSNHNHPIQVSPESEISNNTCEGDFQKIFRPNSPDSHDCNEDIEEEDWNSSINAPFPASLKSVSPSHLVQVPQIFGEATTIVPYIQVPVVTSAVAKAVQPSSVQTPVVFYSSLVCPSGSSESSVSHTSDRALQFLAGSNVMRTPYSIIQTHSNAENLPAASVIASQSSLEVKSERPSGRYICLPSNPLVMQTSDTEDEWGDSEEFGGAPIENRCKPVIVARSVEEFNDSSQPITEQQQSEYREHKLSNLTGTKIALDSEFCFAPNLMSSLEDAPSPLPDQTLLEHEMSPSRKLRCTVWSGHASPESRSNNEANYGSSTVSSICSPLRVRSDLNTATSCLPKPGRAEEQKNWPSRSIVQLRKESEHSNVISTSSVPSDVPENTRCSVLTKQQNVITICARLERNREQAVNSSHSSNLPSTFNSTAKVQEELKLLIPNANVSSEAEDSLGRPGTPSCESGPPSPYQKSLDSPSTPLNIRTDETMPPRGELSEQESMGGNSSSMWSVPLYHTTREWPSPVVSYDLTARESWPGSDLSDSEANAIDSHAPSTFKTTPSFTNTLQPFLSKPTSEATFGGESSFSSHLPPQTSVEIPETKVNLTVIGFPKIDQNKKATERSSPIKTKKPSKPRVFRCKECSSEFTSLKLRRQHPCDQVQKSSDSATITVMRAASDANVISDESLSKPGSSSRKEVPPKPRKKYVRKPKANVHKEIIVEQQSSVQGSIGAQTQINKLEREDTAETRRISQTLPNDSGSASVSCEAPVELLATDIEVTDEPVSHEAVLPSTDVFECKMCDEVFSSEKALYPHVSARHKGQRYACSTCGESFDNESDYSAHLLIHPFECQLCGKTFKRRKYLTLHMKWHMDAKPHKCEYCWKSFVTKQKLAEHLNTHTGNAPIKCSDCDKTFKRHSNLIQHRNRHHLNVKRKTKEYVCHCGEVLPSKRKLEWHKEIHADKPKSCHYCCEKFLHTVSLTRHIRRTHDGSYLPKKERERENIECPVCRAVILKTSLVAHMKIHGGERSFPCHICGKDFSTKWNLQLHRWTHASRSARPFKCTLCKSSFVRKPDYIQHVQAHRNVRPYTCNYCGCQFVRKYNCNRHMREHEASKKFECTICDKSFLRRYYLNDHMRVHSGTRPFTCHICGKASTSKSNHNKHVRIHHAREPDNTEI